MPPSKGLGVHKRVAKERAKTGRRTQPYYMDGTLYRSGDEVLEGVVRYARPAKADEDDSEDTWRLVVAPRDGGLAMVIEPSKTRAVNRKEQS